MVLAHADTLDPGDEMRAELAKYLCVLVSGYLECNARSISHTFFANSKPRREVLNFCEVNIDRFRNPEHERLRQYFSAVHPKGREVVEGSADELKGAINSVVANRHLIAHGRTSGVSLAQVREYYTAIKELCDELTRKIR